MADNSDESKDPKDIPLDPSRRRFLKGVGIVGAGAAIADKLWLKTEAEEAQAINNSRALAGTLEVTLDINDQKRTATPGDAASAGADYIVVGRPITGAADPVAAAARVVEEIRAGLQS